MKFDLDMTDELLATTRAVRKRLDLARDVPKSVIDECLELAIQAPTGGNSQSWRWIVIDDKEKRAAIADIYRQCEQGRFSGAAAQAREAGDHQTARVYSGAGELASYLQDVPVMLIPCLQGRPDGNDSSARWASVMGSIFPAIWSFQLALRARGLGSVLTTLHLYKEQAVAELLGIPDDVMQVALLPVAYTVGTDFKRAKRDPVATITHWNGW
ncbi:MAG: nitroreductase family protein [Gammaproteobacteria bacterium]|jgi:nitroreductase|nr:nitroreductase family protein [Gammaproteobacteria bacterium]MBT7371008.1 nitroreductase family protein [Gammaproteobacteria bacterium]